MIKADEQVRTNPHQLPTQEYLKKIVGQHQIEHRKAKERQEHEESAESPPTLQVPCFCMNLMILDHRRQLIAHVADREQVNQGGNERHHEEHDDGQ